MKVTFFGTRGSIPVCSPDKIKTGGNTTCLRVESLCFPKGWTFAIDAGSGLLPLSYQVLGEKNTDEVHIFFTHWHFDHFQGLLLSPLLYIPIIPLKLWGPVENGYGPRRVLEELMRPPFHPVDHSKVGAHITGHPIEHPNARVIIIHPTGGIVQLTVEELDRANGMISFGKKGKYPKQECMVIRMLYSNHPERTISYRFEENPTGKVFVFLTDHENCSALPVSMRRHLEHADLLVMDSQYPQAKYVKETAGYGHGTPVYCVETAVQVGARSLGLTHHDPQSNDDAVDAIVQEAVARLEQFGGQDGQLLTANTVFACRDYQSVEL